MAFGILGRIPRGSWLARLLLAVIIILFVAVLAILVDTALAYNRIHSGVSIAGTDVGRMSAEAAEAELTERVERAGNNAVTLVADDGRAWHILPADVDARFDVSATVASAMALTRDGGFFQDMRSRFALYFSKKDVPLAATIDPALLDTLIEEIALELDVPPVNAGLAIDGTEISVVEGREGLVVDRDAVRAEVETSLLTLASAELDIPMTPQPPAIQAADTSGAVEMAKKMMSGAVGLEYEDLVWALSPSEMAESMDFTTEGEGADSRLIPYLSAEKLAPFFETIAKAVMRDPVDATWTTDGENATLVPGVPGLQLDPEATAEELTRAALSADSRVADVQLAETPPARTTEQAEEMGIVTKLASYKTEFGGSEGRRKNVARAAELINGTLLAPGDEFDFDKVVGQRTTANGFSTAPAIVAGKLEETLGGGICQVSTTLFNAVFFAGLDVTARSNHSIYISHYPTGRDATVSWGGPAFRFVNDTDHWILIKSAATWSTLTFVVYGTPTQRVITHTTGDWYGVTPPTEKRVKTAELFEGEERVVDEGQTGKSIKVVRRVVDANGTVIHEDSFVSRYPMRPKIIEEGTRPTTTTTNATTTTTTPVVTTTTSTTSP